MAEEHLVCQWLFYANTLHVGTCSTTLVSDSWHPRARCKHSEKAARGVLGPPLEAVLDDIFNSSKGASLMAVTARWEVNKKLQEVNKKHIQVRSTSSMYQTSSCFSSGLAVGEAMPRAARQPLSEAPAALLPSHRHQVG